MQHVLGHNIQERYGPGDHETQAYRQRYINASQVQLTIRFSQLLFMHVESPAIVLDWSDQRMQCRSLFHGRFECHRLGFQSTWVELGAVLSGSPVWLASLLEPITLNHIQNTSVRHRAGRNVSDGAFAWPFRASRCCHVVQIQSSTCMIPSVNAVIICQCGCPPLSHPPCLKPLNSSAQEREKNSAHAQSSRFSFLFYHIGAGHVLFPSAFVGTSSWHGGMDMSCLM